MKNVLGPQTTSILGQGQQAMGSVKAGLASLHSTLNSAYAAAGVQAEAALAAFEEQYCTPATFTPRE